MSDPRTETLLAIAEGRRLRRRQRAVARQLERDPALVRSLERQRHVLEALRAGGPAPPPSLAPRLAELEAARDRRRRLHVPAGLFAPLPALVAAVVVTVLAVIVIASRPGGGRPLPGAVRVSALWTRPGTGAPVAASAGDRAQLAVSYHGIVFPNFHDAEGWHPAGIRYDRIGGVATATVIYVTGHRRAAYTVVPSTGVAVPASATRMRIAGLSLREFRSGDRWIVTFERAGNTCVLTAAAPRERAWLLRLATWRGGPATKPA